jgi:hypothetical protein
MALLTERSPSRTLSWCLLVEFLGWCWIELVEFGVGGKIHEKCIEAKRDTIDDKKMKNFKTIPWPSEAQGTAVTRESLNLFLYQNVHPS